MRLVCEMHMIMISRAIYPLALSDSLLDEST